MLNLNTTAKNTWCPGCTNFSILTAFKKAVEELAAAGFDKDKFAVVAGIGCHGKLPDYINLNSFIGLHGRDLPAAEGVKLTNPDLKVIAFAGDGDAFAEGVEHLVHAAKRNSDISLFVHNNQVFGLTTGQATPTSPKGYKGRSTPTGSVEEPFNPLFLTLASGATFVARAFALDIEATKEIMKRAIKHKGFSFVEIIQPCISFNDTRAFYQNRVVPLAQGWPTDDLEKALGKVREKSEKTSCGIFYEVAKPTFEEQI